MREAAEKAASGQVPDQPLAAATTNAQDANAAQAATCEAASRVPFGDVLTEPNQKEMQQPKLAAVAEALAAAEEPAPA